MDTDVLVVGAGPTGLTAAAELARRGKRAVIVDAQAEGDNTSRAAVIHARTLEVLEPLEVSRLLVERGLPIETFMVRDRDRELLSVGFRGLETDYPYALMLSQAETEAVLLTRLRELGGTVLRPSRVVQMSQSDPDGFVQAELNDGTAVRAKYVIAADGVHSSVREILGVPFTGASYAESFVLADVRLTGGMPRDQVLLFFSPAGLVVVAPLPGGTFRVVATVDDAPEVPDSSFVQAILDERGPSQTPARVQDVIWGSRFRVHHRIADRFVEGRVLLAGDAGHVHSPAGGQGMNLGIDDASVAARAVASALDGDTGAVREYGASRPPVAASVVALADRLTRVATLPHAARPIRNLAIRTLDLSPRGKRALARQLSGISRRTA